MRFILYAGDTRDKVSSFGESGIDGIMRSFLPVLAGLGAVTEVYDPHTEVDRIFSRCSEVGEACVFLCFSPPHLIPRGLRCPTVCVFGWAYASLPGDTPRQDWRAALGRCRQAITFSAYAARAVRAAMGEAFPVTAILPPAWDRFAAMRRLEVPPSGEVELEGYGIVVDSDTAGYSPDYLISSLRPEPERKAGWMTREGRKAIARLGDWRDAGREAIAGRLGRGPVRLPPAGADFRLKLSGIVYTAILDPADDRTNWYDLVSAFCWAFHDTPDATLILKPDNEDYGSYRDALIHEISRLAPFRCRIILVKAAMDDDAYKRLIGATTYYVNTSECEPLCLPLMEFMASGRPAIAPRHTAMEDYIDADAAFVLRSSRQLSGPHRRATRVSRTEPLHLRWARFRPGWENYRLDWDTLLEAYRESYRIAKTAPQRYAIMGRAASERIRCVASRDVAAAELRHFLALPTDHELPLQRETVAVTA